MKISINKERKVILGVGVLLLLAGVVYRFYPDVRGYFLSRGDVALKEQRLLTYEKMIQKKEDLKTELQLLKVSLGKAESGLLTGKTRALAAVDVQNIINGIVSRNEAQVQRMRVLTPVDHGKTGYLGIPVQITLRCSIRQLKEVLYSIETSRKLLRMTELKIRSIKRRHADIIQSTLTVEGFMKKS
ncbi:MAG: hypothetical protein GY859_33270 [Desulfobacterales bacterium]|nr:hypothetical protein [Desulfobacterales bacterium]